MVPSRKNELLAELLRSGGMRPFDPERDTPRDVGLGGPSTEYLATERMPDGQFANYPTIWWTRGGRPMLVDDPEMALDLARRYEDATGMAFPRYDTPGSAVWGAMNRSATGGATHSPLATFENARKRKD